VASDAHAHPYDLSRLDSAAETCRRELGISCAASAWGRDDFLYNENLAQNSDGGVALCFGVHPQQPLACETRGGAWRSRDSLDFLGRLLAENRVAAIGECGFDLFTAAYRETEAEQQEFFILQIEAAARAGLPVVLHVRRAMHKVFEHSKALRRLKAVVFHSYAGTAACAAIEQGRLLFETDAPYQGVSGGGRGCRAISTYTDLAAIRAEAALLRGTTAAELEAQADAAFSEVFGT
jgi:TatD DNase family protein